MGLTDSRKRPKYSADRDKNWQILTDFKSTSFRSKGIFWTHDIQNILNQYTSIRLGKDRWSFLFPKYSNAPKGGIPVFVNNSYLRRASKDWGKKNSQRSTYTTYISAMNIHKNSKACHVITVAHCVWGADLINNTPWWRPSWKVSGKIEIYTRP